MKARNLPAMIARKPRLELESLARSYTKTAIRTLAGIMNDEGMAPLARLAAAQALLDRGWGRPRPAETHTLDNGCSQPFTKVVHEIVHVTKTAEEFAAERKTAEEFAAEDAPAGPDPSNFKK